MHQPAFAALTRWANFYEIVGSAAGALTGLQFVVITLVAQVQAVGSYGEIRAFGTPTVVHFCAALLISALMSGPWDGVFPVGICLAVLGAAGIAYFVHVFRHARAQTGYVPDAGDWFWYVVVPLLTYAALGSAGILLAFNVRWCLLAVAGVTLLLLFLGIHNAWDTVTFVALRHAQRLPKD